MYNLEKSTAYFNNLKNFLPGGVHYNFRLPWEERPIPLKSGKGTRVYDLDGNVYVDFYAKFGAMILGHNHPGYNEALRESIERILAVNHCDIDEEVCELIVRHIPCADKVRFGLSGTEIVLNALRLARAYTGKNRFIRFTGHYNGNADNLLGGRMKSAEYPVPVDYKGDFRGTAGRAASIMEDQSFLIPWNDINFLTEVVDSYHDDIAAVLMEPVCINGGGIMPKPGYLEQVRELCDRYNIVLIFDEIITGFRMGLSGAQGYFNVTPDLSTFGKAIAGGGVPVSVLAGKKEIMALLEEKKVIHAGTFNGYPLGLVAVKTTIEILGENNGENYRNMEEYTKQIHAILLEEAHKVGIPMVIQGPANCASYHCTDRELTSSSDWNSNIMFKDAVINSALARVGILVSTVSRLYSNISVNGDDVEFFKERVPAGLMAAKKIFDEVYS